MEIKKIDDITIEVQRDPIPLALVKYTKDYLLSQRAAIYEQANNYTKARKVEIDEIDALLVECDNLGILTQAEVGLTPIEEIKPE